jgi:hypothetical protein
MRLMATTALLALAALLPACGGDETPPAAEAPAAVPSAARPAAAVRPAAKAPPPSAPEPQLNACALIPREAAERSLGRPLGTEPVHASVARGVAAACLYAVGPTGPALRLDVMTERSWHRDDMTLDGYWQSLTLGDPDAVRIDSLDGRGYWIKRPPPVRGLLLVRGDKAVYQLSSQRYGAAAIQRSKLERLADALLAAE